MNLKNLNSNQLDAGSFYIEHLTDEIEKEANKIIKNIDTLGGAVSAIENEYQQNEISSSAYEYQKGIDNNTNIIVGVNKFKESINKESEKILQLSEKSAAQQIKRLNKLKKDRNNDILQKSLCDLTDAANGDSNLMPYIIDAVKASATLGEISDILRKSFGIHS